MSIPKTKNSNKKTWKMIGTCQLHIYLQCVSIMGGWWMDTMLHTIPSRYFYSEQNEEKGFSSHGVIVRMSSNRQHIASETTQPYYFMNTLLLSMNDHEMNERKKARDESHKKYLCIYFVCFLFQTQIIFRHLPLTPPIIHGLSHAYASSVLLYIQY